MKLPHKHKKVPYICSYLSNGLKRLNYYAPNKEKEARKLLYKKKLLALTLHRKVRANRLLEGVTWSTFCTFESILQLIIQVGLHFRFESRSLALSRVQSCHHGKLYTLELHLLNLLLKLEFLHLPGSDWLLMNLLRDHEIEIVLALVLTLLHLEFPCYKNGAVLEPLAQVLSWLLKPFWITLTRWSWLFPMISEVHSVASQRHLQDEDKVRPVEEMHNKNDTTLAGEWIGVRPVEEMCNMDDATLIGGHIDKVELWSDSACSLPFANKPVTFWVCIENVLITFSISKLLPEPSGSSWNSKCWVVDELKALTDNSWLLTWP